MNDVDLVLSFIIVVLFELPQKMLGEIKHRLLLLKRSVLNMTFTPHILTSFYFFLL